MSFASRLKAQCLKKDSYLCAGIDPRFEWLPSEFQPSDPQSRQLWATAYRDFSIAVLDVLAPYVPVVKPQSAFFEALGAPGVAALEEVSIYAREKRQLLVIGDIKRGDIGSTATAYAEAAFRSSGDTGQALFDAVTLNPYMGSDGVMPFLKHSSHESTGIFVLVKTSNPSSRELQDLEVADQRLYEVTADLVAEWGRNQNGNGYSNVGAVVGATHPQALLSMRQRMPQSWILIPGVGAQGGGMSDAALGFDSQGSGALVNMSRGLTYPWLKETHNPPSDWREHIKRAAKDARDQLRQALSS